jgi:putative flippase GtrA
MTGFITNPRERGRFLRFAFVGIVGAVVDFGIFNLLTTLFHIPPIIAQVVSFSAAVLSNFLWNRFWTYPDSRSKPIHHQLLQFTVISAIGLAIRTPLIAGLTGPTHKLFASIRVPPFTSFSPNFLGNNLALATAVVVVMFWNFFVNRFWTYGDVS